MDEILGLPGVNGKTLPDIWMNGLSNEWNVLTVHAEMEGLSKIEVFENFLAKAEARGVKFMTLADIAERAAPAQCEITSGELPGRSGTVALQRSAGLP